MIKRVVLLYNPHAGRGKVLKELRRIENWLSELGVSWKKVKTQPADEMKYSVEESLDFSPDAILLAGGDGTLNQFVNSAGEFIPIFILPLGSGNDFARIIYRRLNLSSVFEGFNNSSVERFDLGVIEYSRGKRFFVNGLGIGLDARVVKLLPQIKYLKGDLLYLYAVVKVLKSFKGQILSIKYDGKFIEDKAIITTFGVGKYLGGGFLLHPGADPFDGKLELSFIRRVSLLKFFRKLPALMKGTHLKEREVSYDRGSTFYVESPEPLLAQLDGEFLDAGYSATIRVERKTFPILVPKK